MNTNTSNGSIVRVAIIGTSWWADAMYLPALASHPNAEVVAVCGRREETTRAFAERWGIPNSFTDPDALLSNISAMDGVLDAVVVATANESHHRIAMAALNAGLHVLCEKPLAMNVAQAEEMAAAAAAADRVTLVPFTYRWMPMMQWLKELMTDGYVGTPHQIGIRYFSGFGLDPAYSWRFDPAIAGSAGIIGDLGSHIVHLARWLLDDEEVSVSATKSTVVPRGPRPDGRPYEQLEDSAVIVVRYRSGACGVLQPSAVAWEGNGEIGQRQQVEIHGSSGTLRADCDWGLVQEVQGSRLGESVPKVLPIPDRIWGALRRSPVPDTYRDVFRTTSAMTRGWVEAIASDRPYDGPGFDEGLAVQRVLDAAVISADRSGQSVELENQ